MREIRTRKPLWGFWASHMTPSSKRVGCCFLWLVLYEQVLLLTAGKGSKRSVPNLGIAVIT